MAIVTDYVTLWFLALPNAETAVERVAERVRQGGHNIPEEVVRRRFAAGRGNFDLIYRGLVDAWALYDNSEALPSPARVGREVMNPKPIEQAKNPLLARALPALLRARKRAEELAAATNTAIIQVVDGKVVRLRAPFRESDSAK